MKLMILNNDILILLFTYLDVNNTINLSKTCKIYNNNYKILNNNEWECISNNEYGKDFWEKARKRNKLISKPLNTYKEEIIRLRLFENKNYKYMNKKYTNKDYYNLWQKLEENILNKKIK